MLHDATLAALEPGQGITLHDVTNTEYHQGPGLSVSGAKRLLVSPFHFHELAQPREAPPKAPTAAMVNGTLVHCALLEPDEFNARYVIAPDIDKRTKDYKEFAKAAAELDMQLVPRLDWHRAHAQAAALRRLPAVTELMAHGVAEASVYWRDVAHGLLLKCRPDWKAPVGHGRGVVLLDVKTAIDASPDGFAKACANWGYHLQDPWYCEGVQAAEGVEVHGMVFAVVESEFPHACAAYMLSDDARALGREAIARARLRYVECMDTNTWPSYPQDIQVIDLPRWAYSAAHP